MKRAELLAERGRPGLLSPKQRKIIRAYASGLTTKEVVARLGTTKAAVKRHKERAYRRLGVHTMAGAVQRLNDLGG